MSKLSAEQSAQLREAFDLMDINKDGVVTKDELKTLLTGLGEELTDDLANEMIAAADENGDGKVEFQEFLNAVAAEVAATEEVAAAEEVVATEEVAEVAAHEEVVAEVAEVVVDEEAVAAV